MSLGPPPPRRSRRQRLDLSFRPLIVAAGVGLILVGVALVWHPWQSPARLDWTAAPAVPSSPSAPERRWLAGLREWTSYMRDAQEDPTTIAVRDCGKRLAALGTVPSRLARTRRLAADTCGALAARARDTVDSERRLDAKLAGKAEAERREGERDLRLLLASLGGNHVARGNVEPGLSRIATRLSGRGATVRCFANEGGWQAVVNAIAAFPAAGIPLTGVPQRRCVRPSPARQHLAVALPADVAHLDLLQVHGRGRA